MFEYDGSNLIIRSLRAGSQMFALLVLFICVILNTMWSGNSLSCCASYPLVYCLHLRSV